MRWQNERESENVEDRRGSRPARMAVGGGLGTIIIVLLASFFTGPDPRRCSSRSQAQQPARTAASGTAVEEPGGEAAGGPGEDTLAMTEDVWTEIFAKAGQQYEKPTLVLFRDQVRDRRLRHGQHRGRAVLLPRRPEGLHRPGLLRGARAAVQGPGRVRPGLRDRPRGRPPRPEPARASARRSRGMQRQVGKAEANGSRSCSNSRPTTSPASGPITPSRRSTSSRRATSSRASMPPRRIGDDALQKQAQGYVVPDSFTHGTSAQRVRWFRKGLVSGDINGGDTFKARADL